MRITLLLGIVLLLGLLSCRKNPSASAREQDRSAPQTLDGKISEDEVKRPDNPILAGALRIEVKWQDEIPDKNASLVEVLDNITPSASYSGYMPTPGETLLINGLTQESFQDLDIRTIEVQPSLAEPEGIPEMTLLKIVK